jgi:hypothetical protein
VLQQRRLAEPGVAAQDQHAAVSVARPGEQRVEHRALLAAPEQRLREPWCLLLELACRRAAHRSSLVVRCAVL